jgi:hypothetical protein
LGGQLGKIVAMAFLLSGYGHARDDVVCKRGTAEWIVERPASGAYPLADFWTVEFANLDVRTSGPTPTVSVVNMAEAGKVLSVCRAAPPARSARTDSSHPIADLANAISCEWRAAE